MIKLEHEVLASTEQMEFIIEGLRNPLNSWEKSDSFIDCEYGPCDSCTHNTCEYWGKEFHIGDNDHSLMQRLANSGTDHRKFMRMMPVYVRITAPLYWWKEFDTYKVDTVANSCSTMHKIQEKEFTLEDFSCEHLTNFCLSQLKDTIHELERLREYYIHWDTVHYSVKEAEGWTDKKDIWYQMIQLLPSCYNQTRNVMLNYEVMANIYKSRKNHKLDEWREFCQWIEELPYSELITLHKKGDKLQELVDKLNSIGNPNPMSKEDFLKAIKNFDPDEVGNSEAVGIKSGFVTKDIVEVTRCKNCKYYITADDMKNDEMYKDYHNTLGHPGLCKNFDKWTDETCFCSDGKKKED